MSGHDFRKGVRENIRRRRQVYVSKMDPKELERRKVRSLKDWHQNYKARKRTKENRDE